jgi:AcrR family transcriptional regulator
MDVDRVVSIALEHFTANSAAPTLGELASASGLCEAALRTHFTDADGVVAAVWSRLNADTERQYLALDPTQPAVDRLRRHVQQLVEVAAICPTLTASFMIVLTRVTQGHLTPLALKPIQTVSQRLEDLLREARRNGELDFSVPPQRAAAHLLGTLLGQSAVAPRPHGDRRPDAGAITESVWGLCVEGWCAMGDREDDADRADPAAGAAPR